MKNYNDAVKKFKLTKLGQCNEGEIYDKAAECEGGLQALEHLSQGHNLSPAASSC